MRGVYYYNTHAILVFSSALLVSLALQCSRLFLYFMLQALCELLQYFLPNMVVGNIVNMGGSHQQVLGLYIGLFLSNFTEDNKV